MATKALARWRGIGAARLLLGALLLALSITEKPLPADDQAKPAALPADLAKIPSDGMLLASVQVAELWHGDLLASVRGKDKEISEAAQEFEKRFGLSFEQVERLSVTILGPLPANRHEPVMIARTLKPYDLAKVLAAYTKLKTEKYKGQTLYVARKWAVYPLDERTLVYSEFASELHNWIDRPRPKEKGALADALERIAETHTLVFGLNLKEYSDRGELEQLPPGAELFRPLSLADWATLIADVGPESRLAATLHFLNEKDAKAAEKTAQSGLELLRASLDGGIETLAMEKDLADVVSILKQLQTPLKKTTIDRKGETLRASLRAKIDLAAAGRLLPPALRKRRETARRIENSANLHKIGIAMQNYHDTYGHFPPQATYDKNGKPMLSWRVMILPFIEQQELYSRFHLDEPWDSEHNKTLLARMPKVYSSPQEEQTVKDHTTHYQGFVGKGTIFEGKKGVLWETIGAGDGTSNTIMIVEASKAVPWSKPEDIPYDGANPLPKLGLPGASGFAAVFCDGSVHFLAHTIKPRILRCLITYNDGIVLGDKDF
jgi:hypothetical protein